MHVCICMHACVMPCYVNLRDLRTYFAVLIKNSSEGLTTSRVESVKD